MKRFLLDAIISFAYWTTTLTPYMLWIVGVNIDQYLKWIGMQAILVPPLGAGFAFLLRKLKWGE